MQCYVCSEVLDGDPAFVEHHLNSCLDRQGSFSGSPRIEAEHEAVQASNKEHDRRVALALSSSEDPTRNSSERLISQNSSSAGSCPCCLQTWLALGLRLDGTDQEQRASHVEACLVAREEEEEEEQGHGGGGGQHGRAEDQGDEAAAAERKGRQVLNEVGAPRKGYANGEGDAAHETAVMSTPDLIHLLATSLSASHSSPHGRTSEAYLASDTVHHVPTRLKDYGWGCGYKNAQMIFSAFRHLPQLAPLLPKPKAPADDVVPISPIRWWQETIEAAWRQGFDPEGAQHFKYRLVNSRRWIGTTEIYTALSYLGIRTQIVDFPKTKGGSGTNQNLINFILDYFRQPNFLGTSASHPSDNSPIHNSTRSAFDLLTSSQGTPIHRTGRQPLYLQHQGHSRTIVGIEIGKRSRVEGAERGGKLGSKVKKSLTKGARVKKGGGAGGELGAPEADGEGEEEAWLLLFDPGKPTPHDFKKSASTLAQARLGRRCSKSSPLEGARDESPPLRKKVRPSSPPAPSKSNTNGQLGGGTNPTPTPKFSEVLKLFRVNMRELKKKDDYQVLFIDPDAPPLTSAEKELRKKVSSIVIGGSA